MRHWTCAFAAVLAMPIAVFAGPCGDHVGGRRVACGCGDTVVTDTRILDDDPVLLRRCAVDGLLIRAHKDAEAITLDLDGHILQGSGAGIGVRVLYGGTDGMQLIGAKAPSRGAIIGFGVGLSAARLQGLAKVAHLELRDNRDEGARVAIAGTVFVDVMASGNGRDGFSVRGTGGRFAGVRVTGNGENGIRVFSDNAAVEVVATDNARSGIIVDGADNDISAAEATGNGRDGIVTRGSGGRLEVVRCEENARDNLRVNGHPPRTAE